MQSAISLIQTVIWPSIVALALIYFGPSLRGFIKDIVELHLKAPGFEATGKRQLEAAASLGAAEAARRDSQSKAPGGNPPLDESAARRIADVVSEASTPRATRRLQDARILWVDDRPQNNHYERAALGTLGIRFDLSTSTEDALEKLHSHRYDVVISDMGRPPDAEAGYTLLEQLRKMGTTTPYIIYAVGGHLRQHQASARSKGAAGSTSNPRELFEMVIRAIQADGR